MKKFTKPFAAILIILCLAISGVAMYIVPKNIENKQLANEANYPQSAISTYLTQVKNQEYDSIYQDSLKLTKHFNSQQDYIDLLQQTYSSIDTSKIQIAQDEADTSIYHLVYEGKLLSDVKVIQDSDGTYIASTIFSNSESITLEVPVSSKLTINDIDVDSSYKTDSNVVATIADGIDENSYDVYMVDRYTIDNLISVDSISVDGKQMDYIVDSETKIIYPGTAISDNDIESFIIAAAKTASNYPSQEGSAGAIANYAITSSDFYRAYVTMENTWYTAHNSAIYSNEEVTKLIQLDNNNIYANEIMDYDVSGSLGSKTYHIGFQMVLTNVSGNYRISKFTVDSRLNPLYEY